MTATISLPNDGELHYNDEFIVVRDKKVRLSTRLRVFSSALWAFIGGPGFLLKEELAWSNGWAWFWGVAIVVHFVTFILLSRLSFRETIMLDDVRSARVKRGWGNSMLTLKLNGWQIRRIVIPYDRVAEMRTFVSSNFPA